MSYDKMVSLLAFRTQTSPRRIKRVLLAVPEILLYLRLGEQVRTPLGVFRMTRRAPRTTIHPVKKTKVKIPSEMVVKLRPGQGLRKES